MDLLSSLLQVALLLFEAYNSGWSRLFISFTITGTKYGNDGTKALTPYRQRSSLLWIIIPLLACLAVFLLLVAGTFWTLRAEPNEEYIPSFRNGNSSCSNRNCTSPNSAVLIIDGDTLTQASFLSTRSPAKLNHHYCGVVGAIRMEMSSYPPTPKRRIEISSKLKRGLKFAAKVSCPSPKDFCVCNEEGECFASIKNDSLSAIRFYAYCDAASGCHTYAIPLCNGGTRSGEAFDVLGLKDGFIGNDGSILYCSRAANMAKVHKPQAATLPAGNKAPYIKVVAVSCRGCATIQRLAAQSNCTNH